MSISKRIWITKCFDQYTGTDICKGIGKYG